MDGELTALPSSTVKTVGGEGDIPETPDSCREIFDKAFPSYLALGMTYDEFYHKDHTLVISYRKAFELKREERNTEMWLQGFYVYSAISKIAPLLIPFNSHPKAEPYLDKPISLYADSSGSDVKEKAVAEKGKAYMQAQMLKFNKRFHKE